MFYQVDRSYDQAHGGLGIGLTLVKRLVEMHGGTVEAKSAGMGQGSEFVVSLPVFVSSSAVLMDKDAVEQKYNTRRRILVVDDYPSAAESLARRLKRFGNEVETALDGFEGIKRAENFVPTSCCSISGCRSSMAINGPKDTRTALGEGYSADRIYGLGARGPSAYARGWIRRPPCQTSGLYQVERVARKICKAEHLEPS